MKMPQRSLMYVVAVVTCVGCSPSTSAPNSAFDSFKSFAGRVKIELPRALEVMKIKQPVSFDVQKTDSLVSPFTAYIAFALSQPVGDDKCHYLLIQTARADYAYQEGQWVCKQIAFTASDVEYVSGDRSYFDRLKKIFDRDPRAVLKYEGADIQSSKDPVVKLLRDCKPSVERTGARPVGLAVLVAMNTQSAIETGWQSRPYVTLCPKLPRRRK